MGLDMYLTAEKHIFGLNKEEEEKANKIKEGIIKLFPEAGNLNPEKVIFEVGSWRKKNAIHKWFVDEVQEGEDDCKKHYVYIKKLVELKKLCQEVLKVKTDKKAEELLPTKRGFFFGNIEYDEWYYSGLKKTIKIIEKAEKLMKQEKGYSLYYNSSW